MRVLAIVASVQPPCIRRARPSFQLIVALCFWTLLCNLGMLTPRGQAQDQPASQTPRLDVNTADAWATLVLKGVDTEFPNKMSIVYVDETQIKSPREFFPAFYGSFDWHSSVHGHWLLTRTLKQFPEMESASKIRDVLNRHLSKENLDKEAEFFSRDEHKTFERMYGWSWYLRLVLELDSWNDPDAARWRENLRPLEDVFVARVSAYLPLLTYPIRTGEHPDTGFALGQIIDYSRQMKKTELESLATRRAREFYESDRRYPIEYEPSGHDFFSSGWNEADLMRRVLPPAEFSRWFKGFLPELELQLKDGTVAPVAVSDLTDGKLVHLAGLNLNRAWCLRSVSAALEDSNPLRSLLAQSADAHLTAGLAYINSGHYEGDHWLATFGLYALSDD